MLPRLTALTPRHERSMLLGEGGGVVFQRDLLRDADVERLGEGVLAVLERVGILCQNGELLAALDGAGAVVDRAAERARFPKKMVRQFVERLRGESAPRDEGGHRMLPQVGLPQVGGQVAQFFYDDRTGERRPGNRADFVTLVKFGDTLHREAGVGHALLLTDVPPLVEPLEAALVLAEHAHRPGRVFAWNVRQTDYLVEMGEILGIPNWFSWGANCFAHPLRFDRDVADKYVRRIRAGDAAGFTAMPVAGMTAPVTLAGFIVVSSAEHVAAWLIGRCVNPACPLGGSMWAGTPDMRTGATSYCAFDAMLYAFATVEFLRRWSGVEVPVGGGEYCDAKEPGLYAALEKAYKAMTIAAFSGRLPGVGQGMLENGKTISPVQLLLERDLAAGVQHYSRAVEATDELIGLDSILDVDLGMARSHLATEHTLRHFKQSLWLPEFLDRSGYRGPEHEREALAAARQRFDELLAAYEKPHRDPDQLARLRQVVERARRELLA